MVNIGGGGPMRRPEWASIIRRCPEYNGDYVVIVDAQTYLDLLGRGPKRAEVPGLDRWNDELVRLFNSPRSEVRIKMNGQIYEELVGIKVPASLRATQKVFIDEYRSSGKVFLDTGNVPFSVATGKQSVFTNLRLAFRETGNLGAGDLEIASDAITNNLQIVSHDVRFMDGLDKALRASKVRAILKANGLPDDIGKIFISPTRSAL
jgi:predicted nuclease of predicted toxin-antitoxin system